MCSNVKEWRLANGFNRKLYWRKRWICDGISSSSDKLKERISLVNSKCRWQIRSKSNRCLTKYFFARQFNWSFDSSMSRSNTSLSSINQTKMSMRIMKTCFQTNCKLSQVKRDTCLCSPNGWKSLYWTRDFQTDRKEPFYVRSLSNQNVTRWESQVYRSTTIVSDEFSQLVRWLYQ